MLKIGEEETSQISKYNEASLQILRLHQKWQKIDLFFDSGNLEKVKFELDRVWSELVADVYKLANPKDYELKNKLLKIKISKSKNPEELYINLMERSHFLKLLQQRAGKGGVYVEEDSDDFE